VSPVSYGCSIWPRFSGRTENFFEVEVGDQGASTPKPPETGAARKQRLERYVRRTGGTRRLSSVDHAAFAALLRILSIIHGVAALSEYLPVWARPPQRLFHHQPPFGGIGHRALSAGLARRSVFCRIFEQQPVPQEARFGRGACGRWFVGGCVAAWRPSPLDYLAGPGRAGVAAGWAWIRMWFRLMLVEGRRR